MLDVLIITHNEALNLPHCLQSLKGLAERVFIVDSGSTDETQAIARAHGAEVVHHDWAGYARQRNWGLDHLPLEAPWILILDADELVTPDLKEHLLQIVRRPVDEVAENGFFINRLTYFMDQPIRHCGYFPNWNLRLFKRGLGRYEAREVHEHVMLDPPVGYLPVPMLHWDRRGLEHFFAKHNRYSTLEARQLCRDIIERKHLARETTLARDTRRRRWLKRHLLHRVPFPGLWRFLYMYVLRLGVLDGKTGFDFCRFIATYDTMVAMKLRRLLRQYRNNATMESLLDHPDVVGLAQAEGDMDASENSGNATPLSPRPLAEQPTNGGAVATLPNQTTERQPAAPMPSTLDEPHQLHPETSSWTFREKVWRALWMVIGRPLFRASFHNWYRYRNMLLRCFGARIGRGVTIRPTVHVEIPWNLDIRDNATVGDHAILYSLGRITIGERAIISQYAHLCAGTHDYTDHRFPLIRTPITIGPDGWLGADAFVGPGVTIGKLTVLGARSSVYKDLPECKVCVGNPARPIKDRVLR